MSKQRTSDTINYNDMLKYDSEVPYCRQYFKRNEARMKLQFLGNYYKFCIDHPTLFMADLKEILFPYYECRLHIEYKYAVENIHQEQNGQVKPQKPQIIHVTALKLPIDQIKPNENEQEQSSTLLYLCSNLVVNTIDKTTRNRTEPTENHCSRPFTLTMAELLKFKNNTKTIQINKLNIQPKKLSIPDNRITARGGKGVYNRIKPLSIKQWSVPLQQLLTERVLNAPMSSPRISQRHKTQYEESKPVNRIQIKTRSNQLSQKKPK